MYKLENKMEEREKYCRSLHAHISLGTTSDDRFMPKGYIKAFASLPENVIMKLYKKIEIPTLIECHKLTIV